MQENNITYPQYRKYPNGKSFFKILSSSKFEEIQILGDKITLHQFDAKILPDRNYIYDLTFDYEKHWELYEAEKYEALKNRIKTT